MTTPYDTIVIADSPVSYWPLNEPSGTTVNDSINVNNGTYTGAVTLGGIAPGSGMDGSISLPGASTAYALVKSGLILGTLTNASIEAWFKTTLATGNGTAIYCERAATGNDIWKLELLSTGAVRFTHRDDAGTLNQLSFGTGYNDGAWHHVVLTKSGTTITCYVDGGLPSAAASLTGNNTYTNSGLESRIGGDTGDTTAAWNGSLSSVAAYNTVLSESQASTHWEVGKAIPWGTLSNSISRPLNPTTQQTWGQSLRAGHVMIGYGLAANDIQSRYPLLLSTVTTGTVWGKGAYGSELNFSGVAAQNVVTGLNVAGLSNFTIAVLARADNYRANTNQNRRMLSAQGTTESPLDYYLRYRPDLQTVEYTVGSGTALSARAPYVTRYCLYVGRFQEGAMALFLNGIKVASGSSGLSVVPSTATSLYVGSMGVTGTAPLQWGGGIAAHYIWARALSETEIVNLAADPFAPVRPKGKLTDSFSLSIDGIAASTGTAVCLAVGNSTATTAFIDSLLAFTSTDFGNKR